jgi:hypothetical protein
MVMSMVLVAWYGKAKLKSAVRMRSWSISEVVTATKHWFVLSERRFWAREVAWLNPTGINQHS